MDVRTVFHLHNIEEDILDFSLLLEILLWYRAVLEVST